MRPSLLPCSSLLFLLVASPALCGTVWVNGERYVAERGKVIPDAGHWDAEGRCVFHDVGMSGNHVSFILDSTTCTARVDDPGDATPDDVAELPPPVLAAPNPPPPPPRVPTRNGTTNDAPLLPGRAPR